MRASVKKIYASFGPDALVAFWLGVWWICNLFQAGFTELANDEAYYHMFAENISWGYFDHPPMTALLVWLEEHLFGGEFGVRFFFTLLQPLYLFVFWRIIRPSDADRRDAGLFVMLSAATLMLQLYGFIAVPDGPLMMTAALFLLTFKWFTEGRRAAWLWMGVAMALMAYSKYHGALVVLFALAATPRVFLRPTLYLSGAVALLLLVPHFVWQYEHDWASLAYHLAGRNSVFRPGYVAEYLLNLLVVFNPFFVPLYVRSWIAVKPQNAVERALRFIPAAFIVFFLLSTLRGRPAPVGDRRRVRTALYALYLRPASSRTRRYLMRMGWVTLALIALTRLVMIFNPLGIRYEVFDNRTSYGEIAEIADGRPVVFRHGYAVAAKYAFYTGGEAYCQPNIRYRTHQWQFRDDDTRFAGREVLVETPYDEADTTGRVPERRTAQRQAFHVVRRYAFPSDPPLWTSPSRGFPNELPRAIRCGFRCESKIPILITSTWAATCRSSCSGSTAVSASRNSTPGNVSGFPPRRRSGARWCSSCPDSWPGPISTPASPCAGKGIRIGLTENPSARRLRDDRAVSQILHRGRFGRLRRFRNHLPLQGVAEAQQVRRQFARLSLRLDDELHPEPDLDFPQRESRHYGTVPPFFWALPPWGLSSTT